MLKIAADLTNVTERLLKSYKDVKRVFCVASNDIDPLTAYNSLKEKILNAEKNIRLLVEVDHKLEKEKSRVFSNASRKTQLKQGRLDLMQLLMELSHEIKVLCRESTASGEYNNLKGLINVHGKLINELQKQVLGAQEISEDTIMDIHMQESDVKKETLQMISDRDLQGIKHKAMKVVDDINTLLFKTRVERPNVVDQIQVEAVRTQSKNTSSPRSAYSSSTL